MEDSDVKEQPAMSQRKGLVFVRSSKLLLFSVKRKISVKRKTLEKTGPANRRAEDLAACAELFHVTKN
jgi:hypothetical protein